MNCDLSHFLSSHNLSKHGVFGKVKQRSHGRKAIFFWWRGLILPQRLWFCVWSDHAREEMAQGETTLSNSFQTAAGTHIWSSRWPSIFRAWSQNSSSKHQLSATLRPVWHITLIQHQKQGWGYQSRPLKVGGMAHPLWNPHPSLLDFWAK
jgi:hypothetical protein